VTLKHVFNLSENL